MDTKTPTSIKLNMLKRASREAWWADYAGLIGPAVNSSVSVASLYSN